MNRKTIVATAVACMLALTACSGNNSSEQSKDASGDLTWSMWIGGTEDQEAWTTVSAKVTEKYPEIKVNLQGAPWNDYWTKIGPQLAGGDAPCIVSMQSMRLRPYQDVLLPLDDLVEVMDVDLNDFDPVALEAMKVDGVQYALPYDTGPVIAFVNEDMITDAGLELPDIDWTREDFESLAKDLKEKGQVALAGTSEDVFLESLLLSTHGARVINDDGSFDVLNPSWIEGIGWLGNLAKQGYALPADGADTTADDNAFMAGRAAIHINGPWAMIDLSSKAPFKMGALPLPAGPDGGGSFSSGSGFAISKSCKNPEEAAKAIAVMTGQEALSFLASEGRAFPARTDEQAQWYEQASEVNNVEETLIAAQESSIPLPGSDLSNQFNLLVAQYGTAAVNGEADPTTAFTEIDAQLK